jgi:alcohol dehydrogenase
MRQMTYTAPAKLEWLDVPEPELQGPGEALVRPIAVARCDVDRPMLMGITPFKPPFAFGHEFVAEVISVGANVASFRPGERVLVSFQICCGECERCRRGVTGSCLSVPWLSSYGFGGRGEWGGAVSDLVRVPFAEAMMVAVPANVDPVSVASCDNIPDGWRTVGPPLRETSRAPVLVIGGGAISVGLYAAAAAVALGSPQVDYVDSDGERLELARSAGANPIEGPPPRKLGPYPITVDASASPHGLACTLRSTEPGGICTSVGIYFQPETPVPLLDMYTNGITFKTGRVNARAHMLDILDLVSSGRLHPERLTTLTAPWEDAPEAFAADTTKVVVVR